MTVNDINGLLMNVKAKLESMDPANLAEQDTPNQQNPKKLAGAKKRLANLYQKLTKGRDASTEIVATGAKR